MPETLNQFLTWLFDLWLPLVANWPRAALVLTALMLGILWAIALPCLTPRQTLARISRRTKAELLAMRLFADQPLNFSRCMTRLIGLSVLRVGCLLPACLLLLPVGLLFAAQLEMRFAQRPLGRGETALVTLRLGGNAAENIPTPELSCDSPLSIAQGPLSDASSGTIYWNISVSERPSKQNEFKPSSIHFKLPSGDFSLPIQLARPGHPLPAIIGSWSQRFSERLWFARPQAWSANLPVERITVNYPAREFMLAGISFPWWLLFLIPLLASSGWLLWRHG